MSDENIIKWLMLLGRGWINRFEVGRVMEFDVIERQDLHAAGWIDHSASAKLFDNVSHYKLGHKALDRINKVHEGELSYG